FAEAISAYNNASKLLPNNVEIKSSLATALYGLKLYKEAANGYKNFLLEHGDRFYIYYMLGSTYHLSGKLKHAVHTWGEGMNLQCKLAKDLALPQNIRYLDSSWTAGIGHLALLDFFAKQ